MELGLDKLTKESLQKVIMDMTQFLSWEQCRKLQSLIEETQNLKQESGSLPVQARMSQQLVDEKMEQIERWKQQIDEGELYLHAEGYEDYSTGYWDPDWITEYYDNRGIGEKIMSVIRFAKDCVDDRRYQEANAIYEWLWEMSVCTDEDFGDFVDLEVLENNDIIHTDMEQLALLTLYAGYQVLEPEERASGLYLYFFHDTFRELHMEDMFHVGRENLGNEEQFWKDWIDLLKTKSGNTEERLLKEAILHCNGIEGLVQMAEENAAVHPSLYLDAINEYEKVHAYGKIEEIGEKALEKVGSDFVVRGEIALKAAFASSCMQHEDNMMKFCWEGFCSNSTERNFLRLFGTEKMAERYGINGKEVLKGRIKEEQEYDTGRQGLKRNIIGDYQYAILSFYTGDFETAKAASVNPKGSLGWSSSFIRHGVRLILLYLYDNLIPSKAAAGISAYVGFSEEKDYDHLMDFERKIAEESHERKVSVFWNYFQRWKKYFPMEPAMRVTYLTWAEKIVYGRADAIVSGQHRKQYGEVAALLALTGEIKENMGETGAKRMLFQKYKEKYPRHSSFQAEMRNYFGI